MDEATLIEIAMRYRGATKDEIAHGIIEDFSVAQILRSAAAATCVRVATGRRGPCVVDKDEVLAWVKDADIESLLILRAFAEPLREAKKH